MATVKIKDLPEIFLGELSDSDVLPITDVESSVTKKLSIGVLKSKINGWISTTLSSYYTKTQEDTTHNNLQQQITDNLSATILPVGSIILYSGSYSTIPSEWALCDGGTYNGHITPNLTDRFVLGTNTESELNNTGGAFTSSIETGGLPEHTHTNTITSNGNHSHTVTEMVEDDNIDGVDSTTTHSSEHHNENKQTSTDGLHSHIVTINNTGSGDGSHSHDVTNPYLKLSYIMRIA
jgi:microcystin-dependent protein